MALNDDDAAQDDLLGRAAGTLREHTDDGWVAARASVLEALRQVTRSATPVRGDLDGQPFSVSSAVLTELLRRAVDARRGVRLVGVALSVTDGRLLGIRVRVAAEFGSVLVELADDVRRTAATTVRGVLGDAELPDDLVEVHVHVQGVYPR